MVSKQNGHSKGYVESSQLSTAAVSSKASDYVNTIMLPLILLIGTPNVTLWVWYTAVFHDGSYMNFLSAVLNSSNPIVFLVNLWSHTSLASPLTVGVLGGYMLFQLILMKIVPGDRVEGPVTPTGNVPVYKDNGFRIFLITMVTFGLLTYYLKTYTEYSPSVIYDKYGDFIVTLNVFALILCFGLYLKGMLAPSTTDSGTSGNPIFDYYWGTELYPRIFGVDIKVFTNCRFGCTVWALIPCCFAIKAYELHGFEASINNFVSLAILLTYLAKFFWWEAGYMCTIDIILDRAGFYICWGCLCFIPGIYTSFGLFMVSHPIALGYPMATSILAAGLLCIAINYAADWQRQHVRATDGKATVWGRKAELIRAKYQTAQGEEKSSLLLASGFWGLARHFHYLPELGLAFFWSLPGGFTHIQPYTYFITLIVLLVHRTYRDDAKCSAKYGQYWEQYKARVPYKIIPYIF